MCVYISIYNDIIMIYIYIYILFVYLHKLRGYIDVYMPLKSIKEPNQTHDLAGIYIYIYNVYGSNKVSMK